MYVEEDAPPLQILRPLTWHDFGTDRQHRKPLVRLWLSSPPTSCGGVKMTLRLSPEASRPLPAASDVAPTYPKDCESSWPARYEHVEVMFLE